MEDNLILENFSAFISDNADLLTEATSAMTIVTDQVTYDSYTNKLLEGFEESEARKLKGIFDRQRESLLEESASLLASPDAITYAVTSFPMLVDIYADPLLSKVVSVYPSNVPTMSIPRLKWVSKIIDYAGNVNEVEFPTATTQVRINKEEVTVGQAGNVFTQLLGTTDHSKFRLNKRNFKAIQVVVKVTSGDDEVDCYIDVIAVADARGNFSQEDLTLVGAKDADGNLIDDLPEAAFKLQGQINFESGDITWSTISMGGEPVTPSTATISLRIQGVGNGLAVVKSRPKQDILDINCDIEDSFEVENIEEVIQDWKSLYNLDIIAQLKGFVKDQIKLNRDFEIADLLHSNIPNAKKFGHYRLVDLSQIPVDTDTKPATVQDIFKNIVPVLISLQEKIKKATRFDIKYLVTGIDSAAVLKSLQQFAIKYDRFEGETGFEGSVGNLAKLEIITSFAVGNQYIHLIPKSDTLSQSTLVEVSHKPLYIVTETTDSIRRSFIKSRNWIGIVRPEPLGVIELKGYEQALGITA